MTMNPWMTHERKIMSLKCKKLGITYDLKSSHNFFIVKWYKGCHRILPSEEADELIAADIIPPVVGAEDVDESKRN